MMMEVLFRRQNLGMGRKEGGASAAVIGGFCSFRTMFYNIPKTMTL